MEASKHFYHFYERGFKEGKKWQKIVKEFNEKKGRES